MSVELLQKLFKYRTSVDVNGVTLHIRIAGDQIIDDARKAALLESRKLRKILRDETSDEYILYLDSFDDLSKEELANALVLMSSRDIMNDYLRSTPRPQLDPLPDYPSQEQLEEHEAAKGQREEDYVKSMQDYVENWRVEYKAGLDKQKIDALRQMARSLRTDRICEDAFTREFEDRIVSGSVYADKDYKTKAFTLDEYRSLPADIKQRIRDAYDNMSVSGDDLKN